MSAFRDRADAGRQLAEALTRYRGEPAAIYALPRGGVVVGYEVARALGAPLDLVLVRKLGAPGRPEFAIGAVAEGLTAAAVPEALLDENAIRITGASNRYVTEETRHQLDRIEAQRRAFLSGRHRADPAGKTAIVVDDGIATGSTMLAAVRSVAAAGAESVVVAVPVAPDSAPAKFALEGVAFVSLLLPDRFHAVGQFYEDFRQVEDGEVARLLAAAPIGLPPDRSSPNRSR